ncbi:DeoR/GlpR family DNA-binding transcription regulator [Chondrinema litorale]|uniref:DeoR/GlpR family DNA-binding transcription regulator n=1 Tax=Chondrinema litorale TaxID=2994555 RepID=UPI002542B562|nr:DeoR/GlpR family DNA-binding transcription regulator [Chondrinema litorale]UZR99882.1 DeoR/GlpR family DNA-binding transcription regulator [Chondrinema litorale]
MQKEERHHYIIEELRTYNKVKSIDLSEKLKVSEDTIRRDLKELADKGQLKKVHGGAMSSSFSSFQSSLNNIYAHSSKVKIVKKALSLIEDDQVIIIDGGTTNYELAKILPLDLKATVFTNALSVALVLCNHPDLEVCLLGGKLHKQSNLTIGLDVINYLSEIHADICFLGISGLHTKIGITENDREEAITKRAMIARSNKVVSLSISEKLGKIQPFKVETIDHLDVLVTELDAEHPSLIPFRRSGIETL